MKTPTNAHHPRTAVPGNVIADWLAGRGPSASALRGDVVSEVIHGERLEGWFLGLSSISRPFAIQMPAAPANLYLVAQGKMCLRPGHAAKTPIELQTGDVALTLGGSADVICDRPGATPKRITDIMDRRALREQRGIQLDGSGPMVRFACAPLRFSSRVPPGFLTALPPVIHRPRSAGKTGLLSALVNLLYRAYADDCPGNGAIMDSLFDAILIEIVRAYLREHGAPAPLARAMSDAQLGPLIALMHAEPGAGWSVQRMAAEAGMSRSVFMDRFAQLTGMGPAAYLRDLRMKTAAKLLEQEDLGIKAIGRRCGYATASAFSLAFKKWAGCAPGEYRLGAIAP